MTDLNDQDIKRRVHEHYSAAARAMHAGAPLAPSGCCGGGGGGGGGGGVCGHAGSQGSSFYGSETETLPESATHASLGCGNPTALAELREGDVVLDLGSGGGLDVLLAARRVGPAGKVYGLDMTDEMLALARDNQRRAAVANVEFVKGYIEAIPLPDTSVDVIISNCVINLAADKRRVLREAWRVLKPGGRFAVTDIVSRGPIPHALRRDMELWVGCLAGALDEGEFRSLLHQTGFTDIDIVAATVYTPPAGQTSGAGVGTARHEGEGEEEGEFVGALIRATKPGGHAGSGAS